MLRPESRGLSNVTERLSYIFREYDQPSLQSQNTPLSTAVLSPTDTSPQLNRQLSHASRAVSVLLTRFSLQEWELASSVTALMEALQAYPNCPAPYTNKDGHPKKPAQILVASASDVVGAVRSLGKACLDAIRDSRNDDKEVVAPVETEIKRMKSKLNGAMAATVDQLKDGLLGAQPGSVDEMNAKKQMFTHLMHVSRLAKDLLEYASVQDRQLRRRLSSGDTARVTTFRSSSEYNNHGAHYERVVDPDGEGFAIYIGPNALRSRKRECIACSKPVGKTEHIVSYQGEVYHETCLHCVSCQDPVYGGSFLTKHGQPICENCSPLCSVCDDPIKFDCFLAVGKVYHKLCFACVKCKQTIAHDGKFYSVTDGPCCTDCMSSPAQMVFQQRWTPDMNTQYADYLRDEVKIVEVPPTKTSSAPPVPPPRKAAVKPTIKVVDSQLSVPKAPPRKHSANNKRHSDNDATQKAQLAPAPVQRSNSSSSSTSTKHHFTAAPPKEDFSQSAAITLAGIKTLPHILSSEVGLGRLTRFCTEQLSVGYLYLWMDVEQFRLLSSTGKDTSKRARQIFGKYLKPGAEMDVAVDSGLVESISRHISGAVVSTSVFDRAQREAYAHLETVVLPEFLASAAGAEYVNEAARLQLADSMQSVPPFSGDLSPGKLSEQSPNRLVQLMVINYEKRFVPEKHYVFELLVRRAQDVHETDAALPHATASFCPLIYRTYRDVFELDAALRKSFPALLNRFPPLPTKAATFMQRQRGAAKDRCGELNAYFQALLDVAEKLASSAAMKFFVTPSSEDVENFEFHRSLTANDVNEAQQ